MGDNRRQGKLYGDDVLAQKSSHVYVTSLYMIYRGRKKEDREREREREKKERTRESEAK
jgi:hypothetical protein